MEKKELTDRLQTFFRRKADIHKIKMAFLFGSWAGGLPKLDSDVDIAVVFSRELSKDQIFESITDISLILSSELGLEVNVIHIDSDFSEPMLYYNAIVAGEPIFFRDFTEYVDLRNEAIYQMEDFSIFGRDWQFSVSKKNLKEIKRA